MVLVGDLVWFLSLSPGYSDADIMTGQAVYCSFILLKTEN